MWILFAVLLFAISIYLVSLAPQLYIVAGNGISISNTPPSTIVVTPYSNVTITLPNGVQMASFYHQCTCNNPYGIYYFNYNGHTYSYGSGSTITIPASAVLTNIYFAYGSAGYSANMDYGPIIFNNNVYNMSVGQSLYSFLLSQKAISPAPPTIVSLKILLLTAVFAIDIFIIIKAAQRMGVRL